MAELNLRGGVTGIVPKPPKLGHYKLGLIDVEAEMPTRAKLVLYGFDE